MSAGARPPTEQSRTIRVVDVLFLTEDQAGSFEARELSDVRDLARCSRWRPSWPNYWAAGDSFHGSQPQPGLGRHISAAQASEGIHLLEATPVEQLDQLGDGVSAETESLDDRSVGHRRGA